MPDDADDHEIVERSPDGVAQWREGLKRLADAPNVAIKISDPVAYDHDWTPDSLAEVILHCIACFGPSRAMFASDFPVSGLHADFAALYGAFRQIASAFSMDEQEALFFSTANRIYRLGLSATDTSGERALV